MLSYPKSRTRKLAIGAVGTLLASAALATPTMAAEPPAAGHEVISFPQRDFVSASGYAKGVPAYAQVIRAGHVVATSTPVLPQDDPATAAFDGIVEVNHAGGGCWDTVTPDIRPGDKVRVYQDDPADPAAATQINDDTTTTAAVTAGPAVVEGGVLTVHGTADPGPQRCADGQAAPAGPDRAAPDPPGQVPVQRAA